MRLDRASQQTNRTTKEINTRASQGQQTSADEGQKTSVSAQMNKTGSYNTTQLQAGAER